MLTVEITTDTATTAEDDRATISFNVMVTNVEGNGFNRGAPMVEIQFGAYGDTAGINIFIDFAVNLEAVTCSYAVFLSQSTVQTLKSKE